MKNKENDLLLTMTSNPLFSLGNLKDMGLNVENTSLAPKETYESLREIQDLFKKDDGSFNQEKFDQFYDYALAFYNNLANDLFDIENAEQTIFDKYDIDASPEQRNITPNLDIVRVFNPDRQKMGTFRLWRTEDPTMSRDEIALTQKILLNPVAVNNGAKEKWGESPNDSFFFKDFFNTRVMATYDEDTVDPITGVLHKKGEYKLNSDGTYYYENLDGRDIYGKQVLNKLNVITKDGSKINKYDIFDSDDLDQISAGKTVLKNAALVGSMFIPYVGWGIAAASIASQLAGLGAVFGKMISGSDNPTLSAIEGWSKSVNRQGARSQYAQENTWCWENFINTIGDVVGQLKEQRFLFEKFPALIKGKGGLNPEKLKLQYIEEEKKVLGLKIEEIAKRGAPDDFGASVYSMYRKGIPQIAEERLRNYMDSYNNIGRIVSQAYMTAITIQDAYGEAKLNGASDLEAFFLMAGYAAGEYAIINSELGRWILPETKEGRYRNEAIAKALTGVLKFNTATKEGKKSFVKKLFNEGKALATADYSRGLKSIRAIKAIGASGLAEGLEEVSEELLQDVSYSAFNGWRWLTGQNKVFTPWENMGDRYGMSFVGGLFGGGITHAFTDFKMLKDYDNMSFEQAKQELVYMSRNGEIKDFLDYLNKQTIGNKYLSASKYKENDDGSITWEQGTDDDNQDLAIKKAINQEIFNIQKILDANGLNIDDKSFLRDLSGQVESYVPSLRVAELANSATAGRYLLAFNTLSKEIYTLVDEINELTKGAENDKGKTVDTSSEGLLKKKKEELKEKLEEKDKLLSGQRSGEFVRDTLVELSPILQLHKVTFHAYVEQKTGKKYNEVPEETLKTLSEEYEKYQNSELKDDVHTQALILEEFLHQLTPVITQQSTFYEDLVKDPYALSVVESLQNVLQKYIPFLQKYETTGDISKFKNEYDFNNFAVATQLLTSFGKDEDLKLIEDYEQNKLANVGNIQEIQRLDSEFKSKLAERIVANIKGLMDPLLSKGYINSEIKTSIVNALKDIKTQLYILEQTERENNIDPSKDQSIIDKYANYRLEIDEYLKQLRNPDLKHTPIEEFLNQFSLQVTGQPYNITDVVLKIDVLLKESKSDPDLFNLGDLEASINEGLKLLEFYETVLEASRTDNGDINKLFGFSSTLNILNKENKVEGWEPLAEINGQTANVLILDINIIKNKLEFAKLLYSINQGQKFSLDERIGLNYNHLVYSRLKLLSKTLSSEPNKWEGLTEFIEALDKAENISKIDPENLNVDKETKSKILSEQIDLEDAIHKFFLTNIFNKKGEDRVNRLRDIIRTFDLYERNEELLSTSMKGLGTYSFLNYLAATSAVKSSNFYGMFKNSISKNIAPLSGLTLGVYLTYSSIVNAPVFDLFEEAIKKEVFEDWKNKSEEDRKKILTDHGKGEGTVQVLSKEPDLVFLMGLTQSFKKITLVDGVPGSGKTTAVIKMTVDMLRENNPEVLLKVFVASIKDKNKTGEVSESNTSSAADKIITALGLTGAKSFSHEELLKNIIANYKGFDTDRDTGEHKIPNDAYLFNDATKELDSTASVIDSSDYPSLIIIDEVSMYDYYQLKAIDNFAKKYGITVIAAGDFDQSGAIASHPFNFKGNEGTYNAELNRNLFRHGPKLGFSMRTEVNVMSEDVQKMQAYLQNPNGDLPEFKYCEKPGEGLYGIKVLNIAEPKWNDPRNGEVDLDEDSWDSFTAEDTIQTMISSLEGDEKIGYIYDDDNNNLTQLLKDKYSDKIEFLKGTSVNGYEGKYYIVNLDPIKSFAKDENGKDIIDPHGRKIVLSDEKKKEKFLRDVYTAISRSKFGTLFIAPKFEGTENYEALYGFKGIGTISSKSVDNVIFESYSPEEVKNRSDKKKQELEALKNLDSTPFKLIRSDQDSSITSTQGVIDTEPTVKLQDVMDVDTQENKQSNVDKKSESNDLILPSFDNKTLNLILYTFNAFSNFGYNEDENGNPVLGIDTSKLTSELKLKVIQFYSKRIDGVNGLLKLVKGKKLKEYHAIIGEIMGACYNYDDLSKLKKRISDVLGIRESIDIEFGIKSGLAKSIDKIELDYAAFDHLEDEKTIYQNSFTEREDHIPRKQIIIRIGRNGKAELEIPLFTINNPATLILSKNADGSYFYEELANVWNDTVGGYYKKMQAVLDKCKKDTDKYGSLITLIDFYLNSFKEGKARDRNYYELEDFIPSRDLKKYGPQYTSAKGLDNYIEEGFEYIGKWMDLKSFINNLNPCLKATSILVNTDFDDLTPSGDLVIQKGHPFILITDDPRLTRDGSADDELIMNAYLLELKDNPKNKRVKIVYVIPPEASIRSYIENLKAGIKDKGKGRASIGTELTGYKIFNILLLNEEFCNKFKQYKEDLFNNVKTVVDKINEITSGKPQLDTLDSVLEELRQVDAWVALGNIDLKRKNLLLNALFQFTWSDIQEDFIDENIKLIERILKEKGITGVSYDPRLPFDSQRDVVCGKFAVLSKNYLLGDVRPGDNDAFMIHGKTDSSVFTGDLKSILEGANEKFNDKSDLDFKLFRMKNKSNSLPKTIKNILNKLSKSGINIDTSGKTQILIENEIINVINNNDNSVKAMVIRVGTDLFPDFNDRIFDGSKVEFRLDDSEEFREMPIFNKDSHGEVDFLIKVGSKIYQVTYSNKEFNYHLVTQNNPLPSPTVIDETVFLQELANLEETQDLVEEGWTLDEILASLLLIDDNILILGIMQNFSPELKQYIKDKSNEDETCSGLSKLL